MPQRVQLIRVFISSPGDLARERELITDICSQINRDVGRKKEFRVEPIKWETDTVSAISERSQEAINEQIGNYDIYLGVMGYYFGSATGKFLSGTEEEFEAALEKSLGSGAPKIQFYFSAAQVNPDDLSLEQLSKVVSFRNRVGEKGVYYKRFKDLVQLEIFSRQGLYDAIFDIIEGDSGQLARAAPPAAPPSYQDLEPYESLRNLRDRFSEDPALSSHYLTMTATRRMDSYSGRLAASRSHSQKASKLMEAATREAVRFQSGKGRSEAKVLKSVGRSLDALEDYLYWMISEIPRMEEDFTVAMNSFQRAALIIHSLRGPDHEGLAGAYDALDGTLQSLEGLRSAALAGADAMVALEPLGERFEGNSRLYSAVHADFADFIDRAISTIREVKKSGPLRQ